MQKPQERACIGQLLSGMKTSQHLSTFIFIVIITPRRVGRLQQSNGFVRCR